MKKERNTLDIIVNLFSRDDDISHIMDIYNQQCRSRNMSRIRSKDTKPEMLVRSFLHRNGFRFRLHVKNLPGHPDIVLPKYKTVIEVRGCFWHRHPGCKKAANPSSHVDFWQEKFRGNVERDRRNESMLKSQGWNVIVVWGCETKSHDNLVELLDKIYCSRN